MNCKNCDTSLQAEAHYCSQCGAKVIRNRLTVKNLWAEVVTNIINVDNTVLKTFLHLCSKPEIVIGGYIEGLRKRYFNVVSYYALALSLAGIQIFILRKFFPEALDISILIPENTPQSHTNVDWTYDYYSILALINIPIYALMSKLTFSGLRKFNFTEHLVIMTYIFAQYTIFSFPIILIAAAFGGNFYIINYVLFLLLLPYTAYTYKKLYSLSFSKIIMRTLAFFGILIAFLIVVGIVQLIVALISGDFQQMMDAQKAQYGVGYMASCVINWTS
jgi:hypothetical protein